MGSLDAGMEDSRYLRNNIPKSQRVSPFPLIPGPCEPTVTKPPADPPPTLGVVSGSLLIMAGTMQEHWKHEIPKTRRPVGERINLTFRQIRSEPAATGL